MNNSCSLRPNETTTTTGGSHLVIHGHPIPQDRPRGQVHGKKPRFYNPSHNHKNDFRAIATAAIHSTGQEVMPIYTGQVGVDLIFFFKRPKTHFHGGKIRDPSKLKEGHNNDSNEYANTGGDTDNLVKFALDALETVLYRNDKNVVRISGEKRYTNNDDERTEIWCYEL